MVLIVACHHDELCTSLLSSVWCARACRSQHMDRSSSPTGQTVLRSASCADAVTPKSPLITPDPANIMRR